MDLSNTKETSGADQEAEEKKTPPAKKPTPPKPSHRIDFFDTSAPTFGRRPTLGPRPRGSVRSLRAPASVPGQRKSANESSSSADDDLSPDVERMKRETLDATDAQRLELLNAIPTIRSRTAYHARVAAMVKRRDGGLEAFAQERYGPGGKGIHDRLGKLGPGFEGLIVDPGLVSPAHLDSFERFVNSGAAKGKDPENPWEQRDAYAESLGTVKVHRGLKVMGNPEEAAATAEQIRNEGLTARLARSVAERRATGEPLPDLSEVDSKPMSKVVEHHVQPLSRTGARLGPLAKEFARKGTSLADQRREASRIVNDEDLPQSVSAHEDVAAAIAAGHVETGMKSDQEQKEGTVFTYGVKLSPLDVIGQMHYLSAEAKQTLPPHYRVDQPGKSRQVPVDDAIESLVMPKIFPHEIKSMRAWSKEEIPHLTAVYPGLAMANEAAVDDEPDARAATHGPRTSAAATEESDDDIVK